MNTNTEIMTGTPRPPLRIIAPNGAPMKKNMIHDKASVTLLMASIWCVRTRRFSCLAYSPLNSKSFTSIWAYSIALFTASRRLSGVSRATMLSKSVFVLAAVVMARSESFFASVGKKKVRMRASSKNERPTESLNSRMESRSWKICFIPLPRASAEIPAISVRLNSPSKSSTMRLWAKVSRR